MKRTAILMTVLTIGALGLYGAAWARGGEEEAVRQTIEYYFKGHATGDGEYHKKAFHPEAKLFWIREGQLATRTSAEYIAGATGKPAADEAQRKRWIETVDVTGNAATDKLVLDYPTGRFTDYMSLLKIDGQWMIINKTFVVEPKARS